MTRLPLGLHGEEEARELCTQQPVSADRWGPPGNSLNQVELDLLTFLRLTSSPARVGADPGARCRMSNAGAHRCPQKPTLHPPALIFP